MTGEPGFEIAPESAFSEGDEHPNEVDEGGSPSKFKNKKLLFAAGVTAVLVVVMLVAPVLLKKPPPQMPAELVAKASAPAGHGVEVVTQPSSLPLPAIAEASAPGQQTVPVQTAAPTEGQQQVPGPAAAQPPAAQVVAQSSVSEAQAPTAVTSVNPSAPAMTQSRQPTENSPAAVRRSEANRSEASAGETVAELRAKIVALEEQLKQRKDSAKARVVAKETSANSSSSEEEARPRTRTRRSSDQATEGGAPAFARYLLKQVTLSEAWIEDREGNMLVLRVGDKLPSGTKIVSINADNGSVVLDRGGALKIR